jgi:hypothetical protein
MHSSYAGELLDKAEKLVRPEIEYLRTRTLRSKGFRPLPLSLSEIEIRRNRYNEAGLLFKVSSIYIKLADLDIVDRLGHVRAFIALARISPLSGPETRWSDDLNIDRRYNPLDEEVFTVAFIHLCICVVHLQRGNSAGAKVAFDYVVEIFSHKTSAILIPGVGTYLCDDVKFQIELSAGWKLPRHEL